MLFTIVIDFRPHVQILSSSLDKLTLYRKVKRLVEEGGGVVMADLPLETPQELLVTLSISFLPSKVKFFNQLLQFVVLRTEPSDYWEGLKSH